MDLVTIGVLAVQGNFREHEAMLRRLGCDVRQVRKPEELDGLDGLVIPGGESTAFMRLMCWYGLDEAVRRFERPVFGTCAGMIVLDRNHFGLLAFEVRRNAFGRQAASLVTDSDFPGTSTPWAGVFIGTQGLVTAGTNVEVPAGADA